MNEFWANPARSSGDRLDFGHLGGTATTGDPNSWFPELWDWIHAQWDVKSMLDVGCGVGHAMYWWHQNTKAKVTGIDCEQVLAHHVLRDIDSVQLIPHDLVKGPLIEYHADLVWCCEVAEHIEEALVDNVIQTVAKNCDKVLAFCAAPPGAGGYHHVNCRDVGYWIEKLTVAGLTYHEDLTKQAKALCTPEAYGRNRDNYILRSGLIFTRE